MLYQQLQENINLLHDRTKNDSVDFHMVDILGESF